MHYKAKITQLWIKLEQMNFSLLLLLSVAKNLGHLWKT